MRHRGGQHHSKKVDRRRIASNWTRKTHKRMVRDLSEVARLKKEGIKARI